MDAAVILEAAGLAAIAFGKTGSRGIRSDPHTHKDSGKFSFNYVCSYIPSTYILLECERTVRSAGLVKMPTKIIHTKSKLWAVN